MINHILLIVVTDILHSDQLTGRMIYQFYTQRLTNEQIYMQRVSNECILRSKHDRGMLDPTSHLAYQFSSKCVQKNDSIHVHLLSVTLLVCCRILLAFSHLFVFPVILFSNQDAFYFTFPFLLFFK